jgi:hypothetical protein
MSDSGGRSRFPPLLIAAGAFLWFRRSSERAQEARARPQIAVDRFMRQIVTEDGREALQVDAALYEPEPNSPEQWIGVRVEGSESYQEHLEITLRESDGVTDVIAVMVPLGTKRRVNVVDCYLVGGVAGHLPRWAVERWGAQLRTVHLARAGQPSAVHGRIVRDVLPGGVQVLALDLLMPEAFRTGEPR